MALEVTTQDCTAVTDAELEEMADLCAEGPNPFTVGHLSKQTELWVLCTTARENGKLRGFAFTTLERIGGTPAVIVGMGSVVANGRRASVLRGLMSELFHRALMAFPDEDVLFGARFNDASGFDAYKELTDLIPRPDYKPNGEERAWGRRLAKRFSIGNSKYHDRAFVATGDGSQAAVLDYCVVDPDTLSPDVVALFDGVDASNGDSLVAHGWVSPERLAKAWQLARPAPKPEAARGAPPEVWVEFENVVRTRRMVRNFVPDPIDPGVIDDLLSLALRAPSAGNTWGTHFVVLVGDDIDRYWNITLSPARRSTFPWPGLLKAPVIVLPCGDAAAYVDRYGEADKSKTGLGAGPDAWGVPYWHVDTAMATMTLLHAAVAEGLGALFFGLFDHEQAVCREFGIPGDVRPIGAVALGLPAPEQRTSRSAKRGRPPLDQVVHRGGW